MIKTIFLIDDDKATNYFHLKHLKDSNVAKNIIAFENASNALDEIKSMHYTPELIFLDINMPAMDAWEFINEFRKLDTLSISNTKIILLTTAINSKDTEKINNFPEIKDIIIKPLDKNTINLNWDIISLTA